MKTFSLGDGVKNVLFVGAHCDDVEIGCGATLTLLAQSRPDVKIHVVVFSGDEMRAAETRQALTRLVASKAKLDVQVLGFRDGFFPATWAQVKEQFETLKRLQPDVIFTHHEHDRHQDHRIVCDLTWNTFRDHVVLEYEIPKWDGDLGQPAVYMPLPQDVVEHKISTLLDSFGSQAGKRWFTRELFSALMRIRGMECNAPSGYAEAFFARKLAAAW